jgi:hypothetical protein
VCEQRIDLDVLHVMSTRFHTYGLPRCFTELYYLLRIMHDQHLRHTTRAYADVVRSDSLTVRP